MTRDITIGGKAVTMTANAASVHIYKHIFGKDFLKMATAKDVDPSILEEMGFVMHLQATTGTTAALKKTAADFLNWLAEFGPMDVLNAANEIMALYLEQGKTSSDPKKDNG